MRMFTEAEAAQKECPFTGSTTDEHGGCLGSRCMCWQWSKDKPKIFQTTMAFISDGEGQSPAEMPTIELFDQPEGEGWRMSKRGPYWDEAYEVWRVDWVREFDPERHGFCGVAGMPVPNWQADFQEALRDATA